MEIDKKLSQLPIKNTPSGTEYIHILDVLDLTDGPTGTDKRTLIPMPSGGGSAPLIDVTYSELLLKVTNSELVKGQKYRLTDYMTTYTQPVTGNTISSGIIEALHLTATDVNKLYKICQSELYPQDIVYYEISGDIGNEYGVEGFTKGKIYRRIDTIRNNDIGTDWRHVKYDRLGVQKLLFQDYINCYNNVIKTYGLFNSCVGNNFSNNTIGNGFSSNSIGVDFTSNTIRNDFANNAIGNVFVNNIIGNSFGANDPNTIGNNFSSNTIDNGFSSNSIGVDFTSNTIRNDFVNNIIGLGFVNNIIGLGFTSNGLITTFFSQNTTFENNIGSISNTAEISNNLIALTVYKSPNGTTKQRYYNDADSLIITNV